VYQDQELRFSQVTASQQPVVLVVRADPKPAKSIWHFRTNRTIASPNPDRPEPSDLLQTQRRMMGIALEQLETPVREIANLLWQVPIGIPKATARIMRHA
jgi:hypothetical protein